MNVQDALKPLLVDIDSLHADPSNARKHDDRNIQAIAASLVRFGQTKPVVLHKNGKTIIAGNGTWEAAKSLRWKKIAAVTTDLKESDAVAYGIADNKTAELADWDDDVLRSLLEPMEDDLALSTGFNDEELKELLEIDFSPSSSEEQSKLDEEKTTKCPECGYEWKS